MLFRLLSLLAGLFVSVFALTACSSSSQGPSYATSYGASGSSSSGSKSSHYGPVQTFRPSVGCPERAAAPDAPAFEKTGIEVDVAQTDKGWRLATEGAAAGEVIAALAQASGEPLIARGHGAQVPIYASVGDQPLETIVDWIAAASGMDVVEDGDMRLVVDHQRAVELRRAERASKQQLQAVETKIIEAKAPTQVGALAAWIHLSCRGEVISVPSRHWLIVTDTRPNVDAIEQLVKWAEADEYKPLEGDFDTDRSPNYNIPDAAAPPCKIAELGDNPAGNPAGELIVAAIRRKQQDVVVGCAGDSFAHTSVDTFSATALSLRLLGLASIQPHVYTSEAMATWDKERQNETNSEIWALESFQCENYTELQRLIATRFAPHVQVNVYAAHSTVVVAAPAEHMEQIEALVDEYQKVDE